MANGIGASTGRRIVGVMQRKAQESRCGYPAGPYRGGFDLTAPAETARRTRPDSSDTPGSLFSGQNKGPTPFGAEPLLHLSRGGRPSRCLKHCDHTAPCTSADQRRILVLFRKNHGSVPAVMSDSPRS
jgi:hypothetical protein